MCFPCTVALAIISQVGSLLSIQIATNHRLKFLFPKPTFPSKPSITHFRAPLSNKEDMTVKTMHAFCYEGYDGGAAALKKVEIPVPVPKEGEIMVKVEAASVNPCDWKIQCGLMKPSLPKFPCIPLTDIAGVVVSVGTGVDDFKPGEKIVALLHFWVAGGLAEYVVAPANQAAKLPQEVSTVKASGLPVAATTALKALQLVGAKFDGTGKLLNVLITAASGGVGLYAIQLAKLANLHVTAICGSRNIDFVKILGADEVLDYKTPEGASLKSPSSKRYDVVIHGSGNTAWSVFEPNLNENGKVIDLNPRPEMAVSCLEETASPKKQLVPFMMKLSKEDLGFLVGLIKEGKLETVIDSIHPFDMAAQAWAKSMEGHATGKIIIKM